MAALALKIRSKLRHISAHYTKQLLGWIFHRRMTLLIVTGANHTHFKSLVQFLESTQKHESHSRLVVYDLGLLPEQRKKLLQKFGNIDVRRFEFERYPGYFDIKLEAGQYAWKPLIVDQVMAEFCLPTIWMDAGNVLNTPLHAVRRELALFGIYSPISAGRVREWTHPSTLKFFDVTGSMLDLPNRASGAIGLNPAFSAAREIAILWSKAALVKECIAPLGSSRANHRQDQSVFTILYYMAGMGPQNEQLMLGFLVHQDVD